MKTRAFLLLILFGAFSASFAAPPPEPTAIEEGRMIRVYELLKNAEQMATGGVAMAHQEVVGLTREMSADGMKRACLASVEHILAANSSGPPGRRPETLAYLKNAMLRLLYDREEKHEGHVGWAQDHRDKASAAIRDCAKSIKEALAKTESK